MTSNMTAVLDALRAECENKELGWADVYLDNAKALLPEMTTNSFRATLSALSARGFYRPIDSYAWGKVKL